MILRPRTRQYDALLAASSACLRSAFPSARVGVRRKHVVPALIHDGVGIDGLYSNSGFDVAWNKYQGKMVQELNKFVVGTKMENTQPKDIAVNMARDPTKAPVFNYASMAHNNHFYFDCLTNEPTEPDRDLVEALEQSFGSMETLKTTFIETALAMFGPGFVWLVKLKDLPTNHSQATEYQARTRSHFRILTTYLAGTPYPNAHNRQQPVDMNHVNQQTIQRGAGAFGDSTWGDQSASTRQYAGADCTPVLCVNTWEHAWMIDWGVGGKEDFLNCWWTKIDWSKVKVNAGLNAKSYQPAGH